MAEIRLSLTGPISEVAELKNLLSEEESLDSISVVQFKEKGGFLKRKPLRDSEVTNIVVTITLGIVSSATYDLIKTKALSVAKKRGFKETKSDTDQ